ncbi:hypothetical protein PF005_g2313 [Phytophthora fragariae]|uniref:Uncharacterized protein n=1 Tax=Phytophthora fragariae TaxID=53985 RepID=A0A6A3KDH2_9STRA|nr:hypothetical protein PF003_g13468 [Phytophthora fragariae]KAE8938346.1 hypothetical protein PF009_g11767 [Phytophthora fragariae]KAE9002044.1 hypothetical protein PF011_g13483 [Phytophthora fragariae]KAE9136183.1 hypothetical protein PF007_g2292 [Phytophthora fragariae]KAE9154032.1 hypothetical protein PF006_g1898 [Phytophthora fragariae]
MVPVAGKAMRKRKCVTFAVMPEDGVTAADGTMPDDSHEAESMKVAIGEVTADDPRPDDDRTAHSTSGETTARGTEVTEGTTKTRRRTKTRSSASTTKAGDSTRESRALAAPKTPTLKSSTAVSAREVISSAAAAC